MLVLLFNQDNQICAGQGKGEEAQGVVKSLCSRRLKLAVTSQDEHASGQKTPIESRVPARTNFFSVTNGTVAMKKYPLTRKITQSLKKNISMFFV